MFSWLKRINKCKRRKDQNWAKKKKLIVGKHTYIGSGARIFDDGFIHIGDGTVIGPRVTIHTANHGYEDADCVPYGFKSFVKDVIIGKACWLGDHVMVCPGVNIGDGCVIAMGSVVTKNLEPYGVYGGNPARLIKMRANVADVKKMIQDEKYYIDEKKRLGKTVTYVMPALHE